MNVEREFKKWLEDCAAHVRKTDPRFEPLRLTFPDGQVEILYAARQVDHAVAYLQEQREKDAAVFDAVRSLDDVARYLEARHDYCDPKAQEAVAAAANILREAKTIARRPEEASECPSCRGQGCEPHECDDGRLVQGPDCQRCGGSGRQPVEPQGWQPIETAPHMRKIIVHYLNGLGKSRTVMACYYEKNSLEMHDDYEDVGTYDDATGMTWADEGWYEEHDSDSPIMTLAGNPTHWMPLPSAPVTKSDLVDAAQSLGRPLFIQIQTTTPAMR